MRLFFYAFKDGLAGLRRSRVSSLITIVTISISLFLVAAFYIATRNILVIVDEFRSRVNLEVFVDNGFAAPEISLLQKQIGRERGVDSVKFVSKEEALDIYKQIFGSEYLDILEENPLPASFQVFLQRPFLQDDSARGVVSRLRALRGVDEVIYRGRILRLFDNYFKSLMVGFIAAGAALGFLSFVLVSNNIKLTINAKARIIETMQLVGATNALIKGPFYLQSMIEGVFGGGLAVVGCFGAARLFDLFFHTGIVIPRLLGVSMGCLGVFYGVIGCYVALRGRI